jgi:hypothetical protein
MFSAIENSNNQYNLKMNYLFHFRDQTRIAKEPKQPVECRKDKNRKTNHSMQPDYKFRLQYNTTTKNVFRDGNLLVERYDQNGKLIRITPPGYIPFDHNFLEILI